MQYDAMNRITQKNYSDSTTTAFFAYEQTSAWGVTLTNTVGRLTEQWTGTSCCATGGAEIFSYDQMGRPLLNEQFTPPMGYVPVNYTYDLAGNATSFTNGGGETFGYTLNGAARLTTLTSSLSDSNHPGTLFSAAHYNAAGSMLSASLGGVITETRTYDPRLRLASIADGSNYSLMIPSSGGYAPNGDILAANDSVNGNWTYSYDDFSRLSGSNQNSGQAVYSYVYDRFGNRWQQNGPHSMQLSFSGANNRMDGYSYDAAGNLLNDGSHQYFYDAESHLIQVGGTLGNCSTATACYVYDAEGRRVQKATSSGTASYIYDLAGHEVVQYGPTCSPCRDEIYAGGRHLATYNNSTTYFIHPDWLGTERARSNVSGGLCETITSLPFGDGQSTSGSCSDASPMHFTGKERDFESGLDNFGARYNSSSFGRFTSPDRTPLGIAPADPQSWNLYSYARNKPVTGVDIGGAWYTPIHKDMVEIALTGLMSAGEIAHLQDRQDVMDSNQKDQTGHFMATPGQDPAQAANNSMQLIADNMREAGKGVDSEGKMSSSALDHLGDAMHTLQDMTSPMHTADDGTPLVWYGAAGKLGTNGLRHFLGENDPSDSWARFGEAIRLSLAAYVQADPVAAAKHGLNADNYVKEANRRISDYVTLYFEGLPGLPNALLEDAARQCALGNRAACIQ